MSDNTVGSLKVWSRHAVIYEVNIRQYTEKGTFRAFMEHMPRLRDMGVDILWLMPVHPVGMMHRKGTLGSYYAVKDHSAVNPEFGTLDDLKALIKKAHNMGMRVILDWVANHTAWDHVWTELHPAYYQRDEHGSFFSPDYWSDVIFLDYNNPEMREAMIAALKFWVNEVDIDGYRCDMAGLVPTSFWEEARKALEEIRPVFMVAEDEDKPELISYAFDVNYAWKLHHLMNRVAKGESCPEEFRDHFAWNDSVFARSVFRMNFITNHDENSWNGSEYERMGAAVPAFTVLSWLMPGIPLIYSGQEAGLDRRLSFFDKDAIHWDTILHHHFYQSLIRLKKHHSALWNGEYGAPIQWLENDRPDQVISFVRDGENSKVLSVFNLSATLAEVSIELGVHKGLFDNYFDGTFIRVEEILRCRLDPWGYQIWIGGAGLFNRII